jgi:hypothetical protein
VNVLLSSEAKLDATGSDEGPWRCEGEAISGV